MAKVRVNIKTDKDGSFNPKGSTNTIINSIRYYGGTQSFRNYTRYLNIYDMYKDLIPSVLGNESISSLSVQFVEFGFYENGTEVVAPFPLVEKYNSVTQSGGYVVIGQSYPLIDFGWDLSGGDFNLFRGVTDSHVVYIKYKLVSTNTVLNNDVVHTIKAYSGITSYGNDMVNARMTEVKTVELPGNTVTPITLDKVDTFDFKKYKGYPEPLIIEEAFSVENLNFMYNLYGEVSDTFIPKVYFLNSNYDSNYQPEQVISPRLTMNGKAVFYGQSIKTTDINAGKLLYNTIGLNEGATFDLYLGLEGFVSGAIYLTDL